MRIMVTGSRNWEDVDAIRNALRQVSAEHVILMHGDCSGTDRIAAKIARHELGWEVQAYPANWKEHGKAAGPIRNHQMLSMGPELVIAFPSASSRGTQDAIRQARLLGIEVWIPAEHPIYA